MDLPAPALSITIEPTHQSDHEKLVAGLQALMAEDPAFRVVVDARSGRTVIGGTGELHLEIIVDRLRRESGVDVSVGAPQVVYKETVTHGADGRAMRTLLEPVMDVEVIVAKAQTDDVMRDLVRRAGQITSEEERGGMQILHASVALSKMLGYAAELRTRTQGRATFSMRLDRYKPLP